MPGSRSQSRRPVSRPGYFWCRALVLRMTEPRLGLRLFSHRAEEGLYTILAIDHGRSLRRVLGLDESEEADRRFYATKQAVVDALAAYPPPCFSMRALLLRVGAPGSYPSTWDWIFGLDASGLRRRCVSTPGASA